MCAWRAPAPDRAPLRFVRTPDRTEQITSAIFEFAFLPRVRLSSRRLVLFLLRACRTGPVGERAHTAQRVEQDMTDHGPPLSADQDLKFIYNLVHSNSLLPTRVGYKYNQKR